MLTPQTKKEIKSWIKDFKKSFPSNVGIDDDESTFEGSAYRLFNKILRENK